eukprot:SAG11_NODE_1674_length_4478_cov_2.341631_5_plen_166_part_00
MAGCDALRSGASRRSSGRSTLGGALVHALQRRPCAAAAAEMTAPARAGRERRLSDGAALPARIRAEFGKYGALQARPPRAASAAHRPPPAARSSPARPSPSSAPPPFHAQRNGSPPPFHAPSVKPTVRPYSAASGDPNLRRARLRVRSARRAWLRAPPSAAAAAA